MKQVKEVGIDEGIPAKLRAHIDWSGQGDPSLEYVVTQIRVKGEPAELIEVRKRLEQARIFSLKLGAPELYYKHSPGKKDGWVDVQSKDDLNSPEELEFLVRSILQGSVASGA